MATSLQIEEQVITSARRAQKAATALATISTASKDRALLAMAQALREKEGQILEANRADMEAGRAKGLSEALLDRLLLNGRRLGEMAEGLREVARLADPVGEVIAGWRRPNGLEIRKVRVPLGVVAIIYEARPNVTVDAAGLCLKAGNAVVLRGGSEAIRSNIALARAIGEAACEAGIPPGAIEIIETTERAAAERLMRLNEYVDVLIPRGGAGLIRRVMETATVPVIETGVGNCHVYVDESAEIEMALEIIVNAKTQRPGVCNAAETLLVHRRIAPRFLPAAAEKLQAKGVELRGCPESRRLAPAMKPAAEEDWEAEYLALVLAVKVVADLEEAIEHINRYGTKHSEAIVTADYERARQFTARVDAAAVYVNASTRFTDGGQFGLGAEIGISTQKLHARGPMGLEELTSYKYVVFGSGQVRP
jgi:glutamate-5-semialdehyde dehydrogenase